MGEGESQSPPSLDIYQLGWIISSDDLTSCGHIIGSFYRVLIKQLMKHPEQASEREESTLSVS